MFAGERCADVALAVREQHAQWMGKALDQAHRCPESDVPIGAVVILDGQVVGAACNRREADADPTAHAEVLALRQAGQALGTWRLDGAVLVVTVEPCAMCAGAAMNARVGTIVFGAHEPKTGAVGSVWDLPRDRAAHPIPQVYPGVRADECRAVLDDFFADLRLPGSEE